MAAYQRYQSRPGVDPYGSAAGSGNDQDPMALRRRREAEAEAALDAVVRSSFDLAQGRLAKRGNTAPVSLSSSHGRDAYGDDPLAASRVAAARSEALLSAKLAETYNKASRSYSAPRGTLLTPGEAPDKNLMKVARSLTTAPAAQGSWPGWDRDVAALVAATNADGSAAAYGRALGLPTVSYQVAQNAEGDPDGVRAVVSDLSVAGPEAEVAPSVPAIFPYSDEPLIDPRTGLPFETITTDDLPYLTEAQAAFFAKELGVLHPLSAASGDDDPYADEPAPAAWTGEADPDGSVLEVYGPSAPATVIPGTPFVSTVNEPAEAEDYDVEGPPATTLLNTTESRASSDVESDPLEVTGGDPFDDIGDVFRAVGNDLATGIVEAPYQVIVGGGRDTIQGLLDLADFVADWGAARLGLGDVPIPDMPEVSAPRSALGSFLRFAVPMVAGLPMGAAASGIKAAGTVVRAEHLGAGGGWAARLGTSTTKVYRTTFERAYPEIANSVFVHHAIPQAVLTRFPGLITPSQMHSLENLRGIPMQLDTSLHRSVIAKEWNALFRNYRSTGQSPDAARSRRQGSRD